MVFLDAMHCKVQENGEVRHKALYNVLATKVDGRREILGMYLAESEGAKLWLQILKDLQNRGVKDLLIVCIDNLKGFSEAIETIFPKAEIQVCIVHQIRNSLRYITFKDKRAFLTDLKEVYKAPNKAAAQDALLHLSQHWGAKYPLVIKPWEAGWGASQRLF